MALVDACGQVLSCLLSTAYAILCAKLCRGADFEVAEEEMNTKC